MTTDSDTFWHSQSRDLPAHLGMPLEGFMKTFLVLCAAAGLTGCAVYPAPAYDAYGNAAPAPYSVDQQPTYIYGGNGGGGSRYGSGGYSQGYSGGYRQPRYNQPRYNQPGYYRPIPGGVNRPAPPAVVVIPQPGPQVPLIEPRPGRGKGDRDRGGIPNRVDRDRDGDGDGIPNRFDRDRNNDGIPDRLGRSRNRD